MLPRRPPRGTSQVARVPGARVVGRPRTRPRSVVGPLKVTVRTVDTAGRRGIVLVIVPAGARCPGDDRLSVSSGSVPPPPPPPSDGGGFGNDDDESPSEDDEDEDG